MKFLPFLFLGALLALPIPPVGAGEDPAGVPMFTKPKKDPVVIEVEKERAKEFLDALEKAVETKDPDTILTALEPFVTEFHKDFVKPLDKLTKNRYASVRAKAAEALGSQGPAKKVGPILFKVLMNRGNKKAYPVLAAAVSSLRRVGFDKKPVFDECMSHFRKRMDMNLMRECARYFGDLKMKKAYRELVYWIEPPEPANVNDPLNPPASYWKRLHEMWMEMKLTVEEALKNLTGQEFKTHKEWREWARTPAARRLGLK